MGEISRRRRRARLASPPLHPSAHLPSSPLRTLHLSGYIQSPPNPARALCGALPLWDGHGAAGSDCLQDGGDGVQGSVSQYISSFPSSPHPPLSLLCLAGLPCLHSRTRWREDGRARFAPDQCAPGRWRGRAPEAARATGTPASRVPRPARPRARRRASDQQSLRAR